MKKKNKDWHDNEIKKLKGDKKEILGAYKNIDEKGTSTDVKNRKKIKEEFKKERRRIKRSEKEHWKNEVKNIIDNRSNL
jgi:hypothetical protein